MKDFIKTILGPPDPFAIVSHQEVSRWVILEMYVKKGFIVKPYFHSCVTSANLLMASMAVKLYFHELLHVCTSIGIH